MHHSGMLALKSDRLQYHMICLNIRQLNQRIVSVVVPEHIGQRTLANFTLELTPVYASVME